MKTSHAVRVLLLVLVSLLSFPLFAPLSLTTFAQTIPTVAGKITEYPIPTSGSAPQYIRWGSDGALWFTESLGNNVGKIDPKTGHITEYSASFGGSLDDLAQGPYDHNFWVTENNYDIARVTPDGHVTNVSLPRVGQPTAIKTGPDGNLWFTVVGGVCSDPDYIGRFPLQGPVTLFQIPTYCATPFGLASGPDGNLWFTETLGNKIGKIDPKTGQITEYPLGITFPTRITTGPDGNLWFTEYDGSKIGRLNPSTGQITEFPLQGHKVPVGITAGPDNSLWFTETYANNIGRITLTGQVTEYPIPTPNSGLWGLTVGPNNTIWFAERISNKIGVLTTQ